MEDFFYTKKEIKEKEKPTFDVEEIKEKELTIFSYLQDISMGKKGNIYYDKDPDLKKFDTFMILRYLSLEKSLVPFVNILNQYQGVLSKLQMYLFLIAMIPRDNRFLQYPKLKEKIYSDIDINYIQQYFQCTQIEALEFLKLGLLNKSDIEKIKLKYGGMVKNNKIKGMK